MEVLESKGDISLKGWRLPILRRSLPHAQSNRSESVESGSQRQEYLTSLEVEDTCNDPGLSRETADG